MRHTASKQELLTWSKHRIQGKNLLESQPFELVLSAIIVFNLALMVIETDMIQLNGADAVPGFMKALNSSLLGMFSIELIARIYVYRGNFFLDPMCLIDGFVVSLDICSTALEVLFEGMGGLSILRILRLLRLSRATLIVEKVPELSMLARSLIGALQPIFWGSIILVFLLCAWGVLAVQFIHPLNVIIEASGYYHDCERCPRAYSTVWHSSLTMMQQIIAGDSWGLVTLPIIEHYPMTGFFFVFMFICLEVALMNVVLACVVDSAAQARTDDLSGDSVKRKLQALCEDLDDDQSGEISFSELKRGFEVNGDFKRRMTKMDIHENDIDVVWAIMDSDDSGSLCTVEFVDELTKLKRANAHTMLIMIRHYVTEIRNNIKEQMMSMRQDMQNAEDKELLITEKMERDEAELLKNVALLARDRSCTDVEHMPGGNNTDEQGNMPGGKAGESKNSGPPFDMRETKMKETASSYDPAFMEEQRKFMAEMVESSKELSRKLDICMRVPGTATVLSPDEGSDINPYGAYEIRVATQAMDNKQFELPSTRPGLPVALCPLSACSAERGMTDRGIIERGNAPMGIMSPAPHPRALASPYRPAR